MQWCCITDPIAELLNYENEKSKEFQIIDTLHNMFYSNKIDRYERLYRIKTNSLDENDVTAIREFIKLAKATIPEEYQDFCPMFVRAMACIFGVTIDILHEHFPRRSDYDANAAGDLDMLRDDLDYSNLYDAPTKELMGIDVYDIPLPKFEVVNEVDSRAFPRLMYLQEPKYHDSCGDLSHLNFQEGCNCIAGCKSGCPCSNIDDLVDHHNVVGGCTSKCGCTQPCESFKYIRKGHGEHMLDSLQVFKTGDLRGWGVRATKSILKGEYIGEYVGEVYPAKLEIHRSCLYKLYYMEYMFGIDRHVSLDEAQQQQQVLYYLDATYYGNITRFFNHDCYNFNLEQVFFLGDYRIPQLFRIGFIAKKNIRKGEELLFKYNENFFGDQCLCKSHVLKRKRK